MILAMAVTVYVPGGLPRWLRGRESLCNAGELQEMRFQSRDQEDPLARKANQSILREINPEYSLEGLMLKLKLQYCGHLM